MPDYNLELLASAWRELDEISALYLNLSGPKSAKTITDKILDTLEHLKSNPLMGSELTHKPLAGQGYRKLVCGYYLCFYKVIANNVIVYHVVDGRTNYPKIMASE